MDTSVLKLLCSNPRPLLRDSLLYIAHSPLWKITVIFGNHSSLGLSTIERNQRKLPSEEARTRVPSFSQYYTEQVANWGGGRSVLQVAIVRFHFYKCLQEISQNKEPVHHRGPCRVSEPSGRVSEPEPVLRAQAFSDVGFFFSPFFLFKVIKNKNRVK